MTTLTLPDKHTLDVMHLEDLLQFVDTRDHLEFLKPAGSQHYRLLAWFSMQFNGIEIFDIGTWHGSSAVALSHNPKNTVFSFNVQQERQCEKNPFNVAFLIHDLLAVDSFYTDKLAKSPLVVIDVHNVDTGVHDGNLEGQFYSLLKRIGFGGIAVFDDVQLNEQMKTFWNSIPEPKSNITHLGHGDYGAGTGVVDFRSTKAKINQLNTNGRPANWVD